MAMIISQNTKVDKTVENEMEKFAKNYVNKHPNVVEEIKVEIHPIFSRHIL